MSGLGTRVSHALQRAQYLCACRHHRRVQTRPRSGSSTFHIPEAVPRWSATTARTAPRQTDLTAQISSRPIQTP